MLEGSAERLYRGASRRVKRGTSRVLWAGYHATLGPAVRKLFFADLVHQTDNFNGLTWLGQPIWQNLLDLHTMQETIYALRPALLIECGTNRGGSALFYAHLFQLMGTGQVVTVDVERMHSLSHPLITFLTGSSVDPEIVAQIRSMADRQDGPVMVVLDSDHSAAHVRREMEAYCGMVTPGSYLLTQDGITDTLFVFRRARPGPLPAIEAFLKSHPEFEVDRRKDQRFLISHHPMGWLRRVGRA